MGEHVMSRAAERSPQEAALAYARAGWPVFPCRPGSKEPATRNGFYDASIDERQIADWWRRGPDRNVAIATGAPGPDVIDVDVREDGSGSAALNRAKRAGLVDGYHAVIRTPSTGMHLYFAGTEQRSGSVRGQHLDFRSQGGYVVAPPSQADGGRYVVVKHEPATGATVSWDAIRGLLEPQAQQERSPGGRAPGRGIERTSVDRLAEWVAAREPGDRNFPLFYAAKQTHLAGQLDGAAVERLVDAARRSGLQGGEREARRTIASAQRNADREALLPCPFARAPQGQLEAG
jgi:hypothetical protein